MKIKEFLNKHKKSNSLTQKNKTASFTNKSSTVNNHDYVFNSKNKKTKFGLLKKFRKKKKVETNELVNESFESKGRSKISLFFSFVIKWIKRIVTGYIILVLVLFIIFKLISLLSCDHDYIQIENVPVTCIQDGKETYKCLKCEKEYTELKEANSKFHSYDEGTITIEATCSSVGQIMYKCTYCGNIIYQEIEAIPHNFIELNRIEPTCIDKGTISHQCQNCGLEFEEEITELGHDYGEEIDIPPTCIEIGKVVQICSRCQNELLIKTYGTITDHNYALAKTVDSRKGSDGYKLYKCSVCQDEYKEPIHYYVVFVSRNGIAHSRKDCSGMKYYTVVPVSNAKGYKSCEHCYGYTFVCYNCSY